MTIQKRDELVSTNESRDVYFITLPDSTTIEFRGPGAEKAANTILALLTPADPPADPKPAA